MRRSARYGEREAGYRPIPESRRSPVYAPRVRVTSVFVVLLWSASANAAPLNTGDPCFGPWQGRGQNTGSTDYWTIDLNLHANPTGGRCGTIEYTNPKCGGTLESCERKGDEIHTAESYSHQSSDCAPAGKVIIRCDGDVMHYSWIGWERVDSVLRRPQGYAPPAAPSATSRPRKVKPRPDDDEEERDDDDEPATKRGCLPSCAVGSRTSHPSLRWLFAAMLFNLRRARRRSEINRLPRFSQVQK